VLAWRPVPALYRAASLPLPQPFHSSLLTLFPALIQEIEDRFRRLQERENPSPDAFCAAYVPDDHRKHRCHCQYDQRCKPM